MSHRLMWSSAKGSGIRNHRIPRATSMASPGDGGDVHGKRSNCSAVESAAVIGETGDRGENERARVVRCSMLGDGSSRVKFHRPHVAPAHMGSRIVIAAFAID